jgi:hypothetical protein
MPYKCLGLEGQQWHALWIITSEQCWVVQLQCCCRSLRGTTQRNAQDPAAVREIYVRDAAKFKQSVVLQATTPG